MDHLRAELQKAKEELEKLREKESSAVKTLDNFCIDQAKAIKDQLTATGSAYINYNKSDFRATANKLATHDDVLQHIVDDAERQRLLKQHVATAKQSIGLISYSFPDSLALQQEISQILVRTVISAVIESLRDDPALAEWTRDGLTKHRERKADVCLFCNQKLPQGRMEALEAHFSDEYEGFVNAIDGKIQEIQDALQEAENISPPDKARLYEDLAAEYSTALKEFLDEVKRVCGALKEFEKALDTKKGTPFKQLEIKLAAYMAKTETLKKINLVIEKHNKASEEFDERVKKAREKLEKADVAGSIKRYKRLEEEVRLATQAVNTKQNSIKTMKAEVDGIEREIVQHREPAEELNSDLRAYLGHGELTLDVKETGYQITRNGVVAEGLSEGERTAIALLYFLKSLRDRRFDLKTGIVVLDDPVSSLDSNALFFAFGFIRERTQDAAQLFILTHNFTFFRQVKNWFHHLRGPRQAGFFMLECTREQSKRCAIIRWLDPLLEQYESEYHYLFACVYRTAKESPQIGMKEYYGLPNIARRLLEAFLAFRQPQKPAELWQKFQDIKFDESKKLRMLRFLHTHSHHHEVEEPEHDLSILSETKAIMMDLLELMKAEDKAHFQAMEELINKQAVEEAK